MNVSLSANYKVTVHKFEDFLIIYTNVNTPLRFLLEGQRLYGGVGIEIILYRRDGNIWNYITAKVLQRSVGETCWALKYYNVCSVCRNRRLKGGERVEISYPAPDRPRVGSHAPHIDNAGMVPSRVQRGKNRTYFKKVTKKHWGRERREDFNGSTSRKRVPWSCKSMDA